MIDSNNKNLIKIKNGLYLSTGDPLYWEKYLDHEPDNPKALYHVGLNLEKKAKENLKKFMTTKDPYYYKAYDHGITNALNFVRQSWEDFGFFPAHKEVSRLKKEIKETKQQIKNELKELNIPDQELSITGLRILLICLCLILFGIVLGIIIGNIIISYI